MDVLGQYTNDDYSDLSGDDHMDVDNGDNNSHDDPDDIFRRKLCVFSSFIL